MEPSKNEFKDASECFCRSIVCQSENVIRVKVIEANLKRDVNKVFKMWPWVKVLIGVTKENETKAVIGGGTKPKFEDDPLVFTLDAHVPVNIDFAVHSKHINLVFKNEIDEEVASGTFKNYTLMLRNYVANNTIREVI